MAIPLLSRNLLSADWLEVLCIESKYLKRSSNGRIRFLVKYCGLKRLSSSVEAALTMEAEKATAIASDSIEMHLMIKKCIKEDTYFRFSRRFRFVKWYFAQCLLRCFGCYFAVAKLWVVISKFISGTVRCH